MDEKQLNELAKRYELKIRKKNVINRIIYYALQGLTMLTAIASLIIFIIRREGAETTSNQIFMCVLALLCFNLPHFFEKKFKVYVPNYILVMFYSFVFAHFVLGEVFRVYDHSIIFDKVLHTTSGVIMSFIGFSFIFMLNKTNPDKMKLSPFFIVLFTFCFTMTTEYMWEIIEYIADRVAGGNMQRWQDGIVEELTNGNIVSSVAYGSGLKDTMGDMIVNIIGCTAVCVYALVGMKLKPDWFDGKLLLSDSQIEERAAALAARELEALDEDDKIVEKPDSLAVKLVRSQADKSLKSTETLGGDFEGDSEEKADLSEGASAPPDENTK